MMKLRLLILACFASILLMGASILLAQDTPPAWHYEGEEGPEHWGELDETYAACGEGLAQSPIDIANATEVGLTNIDFEWGDTMMNIFNNGHTIQVNADPGSRIVYNEVPYDLLQFHFHHPSEHTINGEPAEMEAHFVHRSASGALAVVGVMLNIGEEDNAGYAPVFDNLPAEAGDPQPGTISLHLADLVPEEKTFFTYNGSLTTPPCSEIVRWLVLTTPLTISEAQHEAFAALFEMNARPVEPLNMRDLFVDSTP
jgi:carbonic anhydrase